MTRVGVGDSRLIPRFRNGGEIFSVSEEVYERFVPRPQEQPSNPPYIPIDFEKIYRFFFVKSDNFQEASDIGPPKLELTLPP